MTNLDRRLELQDILCEILGSAYVYFQPPESVKMHYPCTRYDCISGDTPYAANRAYTYRIGYWLTYVDEDLNDEVISKLANLPLCRMDRSFKGDNLNHDVFILYY